MYIPQIQYFFLIKTYFSRYIATNQQQKHVYLIFFAKFSPVSRMIRGKRSFRFMKILYKRLRYTYYLKYLLGHHKDIIACQLFKKAVLYFFICTVHCIQSHLLFQVILSRNRHVLNNHRTRSMLFFLVTTFLHLKDSFIQQCHLQKRANKSHYSVHFTGFFFAFAYITSALFSKRDSVTKFVPQICLS